MKLKKIISNFIFLSIVILNFSILNIQVYATEEEFIEEKTQISKEKIQYKKYSKDGQYSLEGVLLNGKKEGLWTEFNNGDIIRYRYHNGLKNGIAEYSPEKGEFKSVTYVNDVLNGPAEYGWEEGIENYFYVNGKINGISKTTYYYTDLDSTDTEDVILSEEVTYVNNILNDPATIEHSKYIEKLIYKNDKKQGPAKIIYPNGRVEEFEYDNNIKISKINPNYIFTEEKKAISLIEEHYKKYSKDGNYILEGTLLNGKKDGLWTENYNGYTITYSYFNGLLNGPVIKNYKNGRIEEFYINGIKNGVSKTTINKMPNQDSYQEHIIIETYVNGILNGPARSIDFEGTIEDFKYINGSKEGLAQRSSPYNGSYEFSYKDNLLDNGIFE